MARSRHWLSVLAAITLLTASTLARIPEAF